MALTHTRVPAESVPKSSNPAPEDWETPSAMLGCMVIVRVPVPLVAMQAAPNVGDTSPLPRISIVPLKVLSGFVVSVKEAETPTGPLPTSGASNAPIQVPDRSGNQVAVKEPSPPGVAVPRLPCVQPPADL